MPPDEPPKPVVIANLNTRIIGRKAVYHHRLVSTMDTARNEALRGAEEGAVIIAGEQTGGRGRLRRSWQTPPGNIALSVVLYPETDWLPCLVMLASLAVVRAIESVTGLDAGIKWPNDVIVGGRKVCGILSESGVRRSKARYAVIGIGVNVNMKVDGYPDIAAAATSLSDETGGEVSRSKLAERLLIEMDRLYTGLPDGGAVYQAWRAKLLTLGKKVRVTSGDGSMEGIAEDVSESGALRLRLDNGDITEVVAGDVSLREA